MANAVQRTPLAYAVLLCAASFGGEWAPDTKDDWLDRLLLDTEQALGDEQLAKHNRAFVLRLACSTLGRAGRAEQAIELAKQHSNLVRWQLSLQLVAAAQSESDDVTGALRTAEFVDDPVLRPIPPLLSIRQIVPLSPVRAALIPAVCVPATQLARKIRRRELFAEEVIEAHIARILPKRHRFPATPGPASALAHRCLVREYHGYHRTINVDCIRPGCPLTLQNAQRIVTKFVEDYNGRRLHSSLGYVTPRDKLLGREQEIFADRDRKLEAARERRKQERQDARNAEMCYTGTA